MLSVRLFIESVIYTATSDGVGVYIVHSGDAERGDVFVKTASEHGGFCIHHRAYDFISDTYAWNATPYQDEKSADDALSQHHQQDSDCWCIDIHSTKNYFADVL